MPDTRSTTDIPGVRSASAILDAPLPTLQAPISERDRQTLQKIATSDVLMDATAYLERVTTKTPLAEKDQVVFAKGGHEFAARQFSSKVFDGYTLQFALPYHATTQEAVDLYDRAIKVTDPQLLNEGWVERIAGKDAIDAWKVRR